MNKIPPIRYNDLMRLSMGSLRRNNLRSLLTIGAIAVGISVMMFLITLGMGLEQLTLGNVENSVQLLTLTVNPIDTQNLHPLTPTTVNQMRQIKGVQEVLPELSAKGELVLDRHAPATILGVDPDYFGLSSNTQIATGGVFQADDTNIIVVSSGFLKLYGLDPTKTPLVSFTLNFSPDDYPKAPSLTGLNVSGVVNTDAAIVYLPRKLMERTLGSFTGYNNALVKVKTQNDVQSVMDNIIGMGYRVDSVINTIQQIRQVFTWIRVVLAILGLIAIFIAGIGMFNTLTISLLERTREIGIMKALGVKKSDIRRLFMTESLLMGVFGGVGGIILALVAQQLTIFVLSMLATFVQGTVPTLFYNSFWIFSGFFILALGIAILTGIYPANRAAQINPIEAITYE